MESMKACTLCGKTQPLSSFYKHRCTKDGHAYWCKTCTKERSKIFRQTAIGIYTRIKGRANFTKLKPFNLSREDFIEWYDNQPKICVYCRCSKDEIKTLWRLKQMRYGNLTIDCKDNDAGYFVDNLALACDKCNMIKNDLLTYDEMCYIGQNFIRPKWDLILKSAELR